MSQSLEVDRNEFFHRKDWLAQRIGWAAWAVLVLAALAGLVGSGPLSSRQALAPDGSLEIHYDRFAHYHAPTTLELSLNAQDTGAEDIQLHINQPFMDAIEVHRIEPEPLETSLDENGLLLTFKRQPDVKQAKVRIHFEHERMGSLSGAARLAGHDEATFNQFVYP